MRNSEVRALTDPDIQIMTGDCKLLNSNLTIDSPAKFRREFCWWVLLYSFFMLLVPTVYGASTDEKNESSDFGSGDVNHPLASPYTFSNPYLSRLETWDPEKSYWKADNTTRKTEQHQLTDCLEISSYCRAGILRLWKIMSNSRWARFLMRTNHIVRLIMPEYAGDPDELKILHERKRKRLIAAHNTKFNVKVVRPHIEKSIIPEDPDSFIIFLPPGTDIEDVEIHPEYETEILTQILPPGIDPADYELDPEYENDLLPQINPGNLKIFGNPVGNSEPPDIIELPESEEPSSWVKEYYERIDNSPSDFEIIED